MRPNIPFIITDNQSPWTMGCYGNDEIRTPNLDRLAGEGVRFDNAFCASAVCSPNRATLLTGLMPSQHGVHSWLGKEQPDAQMGPDAYCTIGEFTTLPEILAEAGYDCGLSGKWHLGDSLHPQRGFRYWFAKPKGHTRTFYDAEAIWNGEVYREPRYDTDAIADHAVGFLRSTQNRDCIRNETAMRSYACAVSGIDDGVGSVLDALDELGLADDTLMVFTADHGLCAGHNGLWGMADHCRPRRLPQTNLRVPLLWRRPGVISAGHVVDTMTNHYDFLPTLLDHLGLSDRLPAALPLPGRSYAPALAGGEPDWDDEVVFSEYEDTRSVQTRDWKLIRREPGGPNELYDLRNDPGERVNHWDDRAAAARQPDLSARLDEFFARYSVAEYDRWRGGGSKSGAIN
jgi:arylsulfatase A-like enzyme